MVNSDRHDSKGAKRAAQSLVIGSLSHVRFLVIEDDLNELNVARAVLASAGATDVFAVTSAEDAARILASNKARIDCIICDHRLGDMSGLALLQHIRSGRNPFVPRDTRFIMATGYSHEPLVRGAAELDISGFVLKPISAGNLLRAVQMALAQKQRLKSARDYAALNLADV